MSQNIDVFMEIEKALSEVSLAGIIIPCTPVLHLKLCSDGEFLGCDASDLQYTQIYKCIASHATPQAKLLVRPRVFFLPKLGTESNKSVVKRFHVWREIDY